MLRSLALLLLLPGVAATATGAGKPAAAPIPSYEAFARTIRSYPYQAPAARAEQVRRGTPQLARCLSKAQALKLLGPPDFERDLRDPQAPRKTGIASSWTYYLLRRSAAGDEGDAQVVLWFDARDRLEAMFIRGAPRPESGGKGAHLRKCG